MATDARLPAEDSISEEPDVDALAAALRADTAESGLLLDVVAMKFEDALPKLTEVERWGRLARNRGHARQVRISLGDHVFTLRRHHHIDATVAHVVGGITLSTDELDADDWLDKLVHQLGKLSERQTGMRRALDRLILGPRD